MRRVSVAGQEIAKSTETAMTFRAVDCRCCSDGSTNSIGSKWLGPYVFACILLPLVHFLFELLSLPLVRERQACQAFFEFERMEEGSILVVSERIIDFLVPYHASI